MLSARNQLKGTVKEVKEGAVNGIVKVDIGSGNVISADITMESIKNLGLVPGKAVTAVIKATSVMMANEKLKISARNQLAGKISSIDEGAVNAIVKLDLPGGAGVTATITIEAVHALGLKAGDDAVAIIKATSVMIAAD